MLLRHMITALFFVAIAATATSATPSTDCGKITAKAARLECYDRKERAQEAEKSTFGSVAGRLTSISASSRPSVYTPRVILIPFPTDAETKSKLSKEANSPLGLEYTYEFGAISTQTDGTGEFKFDRVPAGKYLAVMYSGAFSMRASTAECAIISDGIFPNHTKPDNMVGCKKIDVLTGQTTSIFRHFVGSIY
jgi:hypothetical protein